MRLSLTLHLQGLTSSSKDAGQLFPYVQCLAALSITKRPGLRHSLYDKQVLTLSGPYSNVAFSKPFPESVSFGIHGDNHMVHSIWDGIFSFQINPRGKMHYLLRQFLYIKRMQSSRANNDLQKKNNQNLDKHLFYRNVNSTSEY